MSDRGPMSERGLGSAVRGGAGPALLLAVPCLALLAALSPARAQDSGNEPNVVYEFDTTLAPVCLQGAFPLAIETEQGPVTGDLDVATDDRGRLSGTLAFGELSLAVKGKVKFRGFENTLKITAKAGKERLTLKGVLEPGAFAGTSKGKGTVAPGSRFFTLDVAGAPPAVASVAVVFPPDPGVKASGTGTLSLCGETRPLSGVRRAGKKAILVLRSGAFRWSGSGDPPAGSDLSGLDWSARGWGGRVEGEGLALPATPPPSGLAYALPAVEYEEEEEAAPDAPQFTGTVTLFTVAPPLPPGLALDPATGVIAGTPEDPAPAADHVVTAANLAGATSTTVNVSVRINRAYSFAPETRPLDDDDLRHFLVRTHFGVKASELAALQSMGLEAYAADMMDFRSGTAVEASAFEELVNATDPPGLEGKFPGSADVARWWERIMVETDRPFQEVMAFFWHDRMPVGTEVLGASDLYFMVDHVNLYRHEGSGNLRNLLLAMARDPAMLVYLDGYRNTRTAPNENFAREFWELFTLGVDNGYTQEDIVEAARAFTGYRLRTDTDTGLLYVEFNAARHDPGPKTIFGVDIPAQDVGDDYAAMVDITLAKRPAAEFVARKIFDYFVYEDPPPALVDAMGQFLRDHDYELAPFLEALFRSEAFFSARARRAFVKSPVDASVGFLRSTNLQVRINVLDAYLSILGQRPTQPPTVNGWPTGTLWFSAASMVDRTNLLQASVDDVNRQRNAGIEIADILPPVEERTAEAVVDTLVDLLRLDVTPAERALFLDFLNTDRLPDGTVIDSPFDGANQTHLDVRVRGLLYVMVQHPTWHLK